MDGWGENGQNQSVTVNAADKIVIGVNPKRRSITLSCPGQQVYVFFNAAMTAAGQGFAVPTSGPPMVLHYRELGELICGEMHAFGITAGCTLVYATGFK